MRKPNIRKPVTLDVDHMKFLHQEALEQLDLMRSSVEAAQQASDIMRDSLDDMALSHWYAYMDVIHMICLHDDAMKAAINKYNIKTRDFDEELAERQFGSRRLLLLLLLLALMQHHHRIGNIYKLRGGPMSEYLQQSLAMERDHISQITYMIQSML